eukprot:PITA_22046
MVQGNLFKKHHLGVLLRCLEYDEAQWVLKDLLDESVGGHYVGDTTTHKVMRAGFYWPTLFKDAHDYVQKCSVCQKHAGRQARSSTPLQPIAVKEPFQQWGLDIIESTNKNLIRVIKKTLLSQQRNWHNALTNSLWADWVTPKTSISTLPYFLVYRKEAIFPPNLYLPTLKLAQESQGTPFPSIQSWIDTLVKLDEERFKTKEKFAIHQAWIKRWFDGKSTGSHKFELGDLVLK